MKETYEVGPGRTVVITVEVTGTEDQEAKLPSRNLYTDEEVAALQASEAELVAGPLQRRIVELERQRNEYAAQMDAQELKIQSYDRDRHTERDRADRERQRASELKDRLSSSEELVQEERIRGNNLAERLAKAEKALAESRELVAFKDNVIRSANEDLETVRGHADRLRKRAEEAESKLMEGHVCTGGCSGNQHVAFVGRQALVKLENQVAELTRRIDNARVLLSDARVVEARNKSVTTLETVLGGAIGKALDTLA